ILPGRIPERPRLESGERLDYDLAVAAVATPQQFGGGVALDKPLIPVQAGIQPMKIRNFALWIPACAGMSGNQA
ncbi:MAG: hypothetical protein WCA05_17700, partial [Pseudolabrys sp.]